VARRAYRRNSLCDAPLIRSKTGRCLISATPTPSFSYAAQLTEGGLFAIMEEPGFEGIVAKAAS